MGIQALHIHTDAYIYLYIYVSRHICMSCMYENLISIYIYICACLCMCITIQTYTKASLKGFISFVYEVLTVFEERLACLGDWAARL